MKQSLKHQFPLAALVPKPGQPGSPAPRIRGDSTTKKGVCDEQTCVLVARGRTRQTLDFVMGNGTLTKARLTAGLKPKLSTDALLVSNAEGFSHETVP